jgi:hypothetical protein
MALAQQPVSEKRSSGWLITQQPCFRTAAEILKTLFYADQTIKGLSSAFSPASLPTPVLFCRKEEKPVNL